MKKKDKDEVLRIFWQAFQTAQDRAVQDRNVFVEFNCPHCGHLTLASRKIENASFMASTATYTPVSDKYRYCFSCGKHFRLEPPPLLFQEVKREK